MKDKSPDKLSKLFTRHTLLTRIIPIGLIIIICVGAFFGWREYSKRQTAAYTLKKFIEACNPPQLDLVAQLVDFNTLSEDLAIALKKTFPYFERKGSQIRDIKDLLQTAILKNLIQGNNQNDSTEDNNDLKKEKIAIIPPDFLTQIANTIQLREIKNDAALAIARIKNPFLKEDFTLVLNMKKSSRGWIIHSIANSLDLSSQMRIALLEWYNNIIQTYTKKNNAILNRMNQILPIVSSSADVGLIDKGKELILVIRVIARNKGNLQINNFNLKAVVRGSDNKVLIDRNLNTAMPVGPGEDFIHNWQFNLESSSDLAQKLMYSSPLKCSVTWNTLGLNNGEVLHIKELPDLNKKCIIEGHEHPEGFCLLPIFTN